MSTPATPGATPPLRAPKQVTILRALYKRMAYIFATLDEHDVENAVLGSFGMGVFKDNVAAIVRTRSRRGRRVLLQLFRSHRACGTRRRNARDIRPRLRECSTGGCGEVGCLGTAAWEWGKLHDWIRADVHAVLGGYWLCSYPMAAQCEPSTVRVGLSNCGDPSTGCKGTPIQHHVSENRYRTPPSFSEPRKQYVLPIRPRFVCPMHHVSCA